MILKLIVLLRPCFWGVIIDECLTWKPHILNLTRKISKSLGIIYKSSFCLNKNSLFTLYYSLVYPYLYYCACVWGLTYHSNLKRLVTLQRRAVRTISRSAFDAHTDPIFKSLRVNVTKNQRNRGHSSKFNFAHTLSIGRPKSHTYDKDVRLLKFSFVWEKST